MGKHQSAEVRHAVTILELLIVVAILATLTALILPAIGAARETARMVTCKSRVRQVCLGMNQLIDSRNGVSPMANGGTASGLSLIHI